MTVKVLTEQNLEFLRLKGGCTGSYESTLVKTPHCWKSHVTAHINNLFFTKHVRNGIIISGSFSLCVCVWGGGGVLLKLVHTLSLEPISLRL